MYEQYHRWYSPYIERETEMLTFGHAGIPLILFPTSMGSFFQNKDFGLVESLSWFVNNGLIKVYCPDSFDKMSWYNKHLPPPYKVLNHIAYERMIMHEVVERASYETGHYRVMTGGCSFGGYHCVNIAFRNPHRFSYTISMGGAFDIKSFLHGYYDENCYFNNPVDYMPNLNNGAYYEAVKNMGIILASGEWDICKGDNEYLSTILKRNAIPHWFECNQGVGHDWNWWREMLPRFLGIITQK
jgi:esterase/lipase superfamily enzyme